MKKKTEITNKGKILSTTKAISQPEIKATVIPEIVIAITYKVAEIFSPIAPWNTIVSEENYDDRDAWLIVSNHPIYCLSRLPKYYFLH